MEALKKGMNRKQRELARLGSRGQGTVQRTGSNQQKELTHRGVQGRGIEQGPIGKGSKGPETYETVSLPGPKRRGEPWRSSITALQKDTMENTL